MLAFKPMLNQINLIVADMAASARFYRLLGLQFERPADGKHVELYFRDSVSGSNWIQRDLLPLGVSECVTIHRRLFAA